MSKQLVVLIVFVLCTGYLTAQSAEGIVDTLFIEEVVVTHSKTPLPLRKTVKPVQVITKEVIEQNLGKDLAQLLNEQSGILVNGAYSAPGKDKGIYIRGASSEYTLLLVDGQPISDPSGIGGAFDLRLFPLNQIERIEILKGSQSTLYGSDALGGVINIITRQSGDRAIGVFANAAYGSYHTFNGNVGLNGKTGVFDYNVSLNSQTTDGISEALDNDPSVEFDKDGFNMLNTQANLGITFTDQFSLRPFFRYSDFDSDFDDGSFTDAPNTYQSEVINTGALLQFHSAKVRAHLNYGYTNTDRVFNSSFGVSAFKGRFNNLDGWLNYEFSETLQLVGGINYQGVKMLDKAATVADPSAEIISPYLTLLLSDLNNFNAELGYRYNHHSSFGSNSNFSVALSYWLDANFKMFSNFTTGFKAPNLFQLYGQFGANPDLNPQTSRSFELGFQHGTAQNKLFGRLTYFKRNIRDVIAYTFENGYFNQDEQNDQGIDIEVSWQVSEQLSFKGQYSFVTGEITTPNGLGKDTTFYNLIRRPKHSFGLMASYHPVENLLFTAQLRQFGERDDLFFNPDNFYTAETVVLDRYLLLNLYAEYRLLNNQLAFFVDAKNVTNQDFTEVYGFNTVGFNILGGMRFKF